MISGVGYFTELPYHTQKKAVKYFIGYHRRSEGDIVFSTVCLCVLSVNTITPELLDHDKIIRSKGRTSSKMA